jgi:hypothetical protein
LSSPVDCGDFWASKAARAGVVVTIADNKIDKSVNIRKDIDSSIERDK